MSSPHAIAVRGALLLLLIPVGTTIAAAAKNTFNPSIEIGAGYSNNIAFTGPGGETGNTDTARTIELVLPYERETRKSKLRLRYRPLLGAEIAPPRAASLSTGPAG